MKNGHKTFDDPAKLKTLYSDPTVGAIYGGMNGTELNLGCGGGADGDEDGGGGADGDEDGGDGD
eukprot:2640504-Prymnesium_polylepis.3